MGKGQLDSSWAILMWSDGVPTEVSRKARWSEANAEATMLKLSTGNPHSVDEAVVWDEQRASQIAAAGPGII